MFNGEVVKIETDKLCAIVNEMRRNELNYCSSLGSKVHSGELSVYGAEEIFRHVESRMFGAFEVLELAGIINVQEYNELTEKWCLEAEKRYKDSLHSGGVN